MAAAFAQKQRTTSGLSLAERDQSFRLFISHCDQEYTFLAVTRLVINQAALLTQNYKLRGYDAVQLAAALVANQLAQQVGETGVLFISADSDLLLAAQAEGLSTDNPNAH